MAVLYFLQFAYFSLYINCLHGFRSHLDMVEGFSVRGQARYEKPIGRVGRLASTRYVV